MAIANKAGSWMNDRTDFGSAAETVSSRTSAYWSRWAPIWDTMLRLVGLDDRYREQSISALGLKKGQTVLDVACGTGLNFARLFEAVGPGGRIIAIDIAPGMLKKAQERVRKNGWQNIDLIQGDISRIHLPTADAATAFWCMISIPDYRTALENLVSSLSPGGKLAVLDFKRVDGFPGVLVNPIFAQVCLHTRQDIEREPWLDMERLLGNVQKREWKLRGLLLSNVYLAWGQVH